MTIIPRSLSTAYVKGRTMDIVSMTPGIWSVGTINPDRII